VQLVLFTLLYLSVFSLSLVFSIPTARRKVVD